MPPLHVTDPDPSWPAQYRALAARITTALGPERILHIAHVGSTSVPGLPAKPVIDIDLVVPDPTDEAAYVARLVGEGWEQATGTGRGADGGAGLQFLSREPGWYEHRFFVCEDPSANVHVFGPGCPEVERHRVFREWLLAHPEDCELYANTKREAAQASHEAGENVMAYNARKEPVLQQILNRALKAGGLLDE